ncbi:hypothetical protein BYT27DRAFT_6679991 [Phlegmacium glaucopus]|nr:hypothetical protein BYT27DRAFT_6679991 [Phlegmacium glaucopus]
MVRDEIGHYNRHEVMRLSIADFVPIGLFLEGFFYGLYSGIFSIYLLKRSTDKRNNILFYALCALYILSAVTVVVDIARFTYYMISIGNLPVTTLLQLALLEGQYLVAVISSLNQS